MELHIDYESSPSTSSSRSKAKPPKFFRVTRMVINKKDRSELK